MEHMHPDDRQFLVEQFAFIGREFSSIRQEMATKDDLEELATMVQRGFSEMDGRLVRVEDSVGLLLKQDVQGQIDHLRDDMRLVKTKLNMV